jgi:hypothetical protein
LAQIELDEYVSGVSIECSRYTLATDTQDVYDDILLAGDTRIDFNGPFEPSSLVVSTGIIKEVTTNYIIVTMSEEGKCKISGLPYEETTFSLSQNEPFIEAGEFENIKEFSGCTIYNIDEIRKTLGSLMKYYSLRKKVSIKYLEENEKVGNWSNIKDTAARGNASLIETQSIDLSNGFISQASCRGYNLIINSGYYTGNEVVTNPGIGGYIL